MTDVLIKRELLERCRARLYGLMQADLSTELAALLAGHAEQHLEMVDQSVEVVEVRGLQWLDTGHYRKKPPQFGYNPHDWNPLMTVAQHQRIMAALADNSGKPNLSAGCKAVPAGLVQQQRQSSRRARAGCTPALTATRRARLRAGAG